MPDARIIALLRNPVERAFSHYLMRSERAECLQMVERFPATKKFEAASVITVITWKEVCTSSICNDFTTNSR